MWYYRCHSHNENLNAKKLHGQLDELLHELELSTEHIKYLEDKVIAKLKTHLSDQELNIKLNKPI